MQTYQLLEEWDNLTEERKWNAWLRLIDKVNKNVATNGFESMESYIIDAIQLADQMSEDDYFGTEGLDL